MDDIRPPRPRKSTAPTIPIDHQLPPPPEKLLLKEHASPTQLPAQKKWRILGLIAVPFVILLAGYLWYLQQLSPVVASPNAPKERVVIAVGSTSSIASTLQQQGLIRNELVFLLHARLSGSEGKLQAGTYSLSPSYSVQEIIEHLTSGRVDEFTITFLPGGTLAEHEKVLRAAGYSDPEIETALAKSYSLHLFAGKPKSVTLEGYIYGETYNFSTSASVEDILLRTFKEYQSVLKAHNLEAGFKKQGLTLYQGIIMASIVQREVPGAKDQRQVAQVFLKRFREGMTLGSDVTAYYGADLVRKPRAVSVDTPYNTRLHTGLPPGPIASPGLSALQAVATPASGDYLYFLSGDDEITYFAHTDVEHEANIRSHCAKKCAIE